MKEKSMELSELLSIVERRYPNTMSYIFDHSASIEAQLNEAIRAMRVAKDDLDGVIEALRDKLCKVKDDNTRDG